MLPQRDHRRIWRRRFVGPHLRGFLHRQVGATVERRHVLNLRNDFIARRSAPNSSICCYQDVGSTLMALKLDTVVRGPWTAQLTDAPSSPGMAAAVMTKPSGNTPPS